MSNDYNEIGADFGQVEDELLYLVYRDIPGIVKKNINPDAGTIRALDFGCGPGLSTGILKEAFSSFGTSVSMVGVDRNEENIALARQRGGSEIRLINNNKIPFADGEFDIAFCIFVLLEQEDMEAMSEVILEIRRCLKPGGTLITLNTTVDAYNPSYKWLYLENNHPGNEDVVRSTDKNLRKVKIGLKNTQHPIVFEDYLWREEDYDAAFERCGMEVLDKHYTLGYESEDFAWHSELERAPYVIHTAVKR